MMNDIGYIKFDKNSARVIVMQELTELQARIADNMRAAGQVASGKTIDSMHVETEEQRGTLWGRAFFGVLETGSGPHRQKANPPINFFSIIRKWMEAKHIHGIDENDTNSIAWAITKTIQKKGTKLYRKGGRSDIYSNEIPITIQRINDRLFTLVKTDVKSIKLNNYVQFKGGTE